MFFFNEGKMSNFWVFKIDKYFKNDKITSHSMEVLIYDILNTFVFMCKHFTWFFYRQWIFFIHYILTKVLSLSTFPTSYYLSSHLDPFPFRLPLDQRWVKIRWN